MEGVAQKGAEAPVGGLERRIDVRYDANCPAIVELNFVDGVTYFALTGVLVNISVQGCLVSSDNMPWKHIDAEKLKTSIFDIIIDKCRVYMPWSNTHQTGEIRRVGTFTMALKFEETLPEELVLHIAEREPSEHLRYKPRNAWKYNRILYR